MQLELRDGLTGLAVLVTVLKFAYDYFIMRAAQDAKIASMATRLNTIDAQLTDLNAFTDVLRGQMPKIDLFWDFIRENLPKMLVHPNDPERDLLLMKLSNNTISHAEGIHLKAILENDFEHMTDKRNTEALINRFSLLSLEQLLLQEGR